MALVPAACSELVAAGQEVYIESGAGEASGYSDDHYRQAGVRIEQDAESLYRMAELVVKVKEPYAAEIDYLRADHTLFCYLHLAALPQLRDRLVETGLCAVAFETVTGGHGLPLLAPMSEIAGRISVQVGTHLLHTPAGGRGLLLGGVAGTERGNVVVIGAGAAGSHAAAMAAAIGANVLVFDRRAEALEQARQLGPNVSTGYAFPDSIAEAVRDADLVVGAVLITGARAPRVVTREMVGSMNPGSVIADISVDQGGCVETTRATTYEDPVYQVDGVNHFTVTNMPGAVPRSASQALSGALIGYVSRLTRPGWRDDPALAAGINVDAGKIVHPALL